MKTTSLQNPFLTAVRELAEDLLAFFRFTEADARALLSAYGLYALEMDGLQKGSKEQKEPGRGLGTVSRRRIGEAPRPFPIGVHQDFTRANWTTPSRNRISRTRKVTDRSQRCVAFGFAPSRTLRTLARDCMRLDSCTTS